MKLKLIFIIIINCFFSITDIYAQKIKIHYHIGYNCSKRIIEFEHIKLSLSRLRWMKKEGKINSIQYQIEKIEIEKQFKKWLKKRNHGIKL